MTNEEAIQYIRNAAWLGANEDRDKIEEAVELAVEALKAQDRQAIIAGSYLLEGVDKNISRRKGVFIPDITVEMFRNASLEGVEELMACGEMEDISLPSAQPDWGKSVGNGRPLADCEIIPRLQDIKRQIGGSYAIDRAIEVLEGLRGKQDGNT